MPASEPHHIIAIGASAAGVEEIDSFFDHPPLEGVSYVIVRDLSAGFKNKIVKLLTRHTKIVVKKAANGMKVISNQVYIIPDDKLMTIRNGRLYLADKENEFDPHLTINSFFTSLAVDRGKKAIGIILAGLGNDGTEGITAIKKAGGMVIARNPETTAFASMPANVIATGLVDYVLEPELMHSAIEDYIKYGGELLADNKNDEKDISAIVNLVKEKSALDFSDYKHATLLRRTKRRAADSNFTSLGHYLEFLKNAPQEVEALAKDFLISVTSFFRDNDAFNFIKSNVLPEIFEKLIPGEELKMWVTGCATGEEAYSIAILVAEQLKDDFKDRVVKIFATDIDSAALIHAGRGIYNSSIAKNVSAVRLKKYFLKEGDDYKVKPEIRKMVIFARHDLVKNPPYCNMHFISCRNLLIYMTPVLQKKIFSMLLFGLKTDGYLFLGSSENPLPIIKNLDVISQKWKIYMNHETKRELHLDAFLLPELMEIRHMPSHFSRDDAFRNINNTLAEAMHVSLAKELDYLVVCIDENDIVVKSYGDTTKYLLSQNFNSNLKELLPKPLAVAFNTLSVNALETNEKVTFTGIKIKQNNTVLSVKLSVSPIIIKNEGKRFLQVTFSEDVTAIRKEDRVFDESAQIDEYTINLEEQLKELKENLHSTYEQLDASYENLQSFNEELLSSNEEMQSVNEELETLNTNYHSKNKELQEINDDLNNYFRSNVNGQIFVNKDLLLMRFSPGTVNLINLIDSDIGRPLGHISTNIKFETIIDDVKKVLADGSVVTKEIETNNGKWYQVVTMPYIQQSDKKSTGAIITFNDISELKKAQSELDKKNQSLQRINADLDNFVYTVSHDLLSPLNNIEQSITVITNDIKVTDPELKKLLEVINISIKKFRSLIIDIATIGKLENDMIAMQMVDLDELIDNIEWSLEDKIKSSGAVITRQLDVKHILFSKKNMRSILFNLISNGIKFRGSAPPEILVNTKKEDNYVILSVKDNGIGIPEKGIEKIFEMYGRLHQDIEGHGIGLYLAKKIVDAAGGTVVVKSEPGKGSEFIISIKNEPGL